MLVTRHRERISEITQLTFDAIVTSLSTVPPGVRIVCAIITEQLQATFPTMNIVVIAEVLLLRLICDALENPEIYYIVNGNSFHVVTESCRSSTSYISSRATVPFKRATKHCTSSQHR
jgi:hypothetical protein